MIEQTHDLTIPQALDLGVRLAVHGRHPEAMGLFRGVLAHEPGNFEAIERLGSSLFESGRTHEALYWFWRGRKISRKHPLALTNYGLVLSHLGHPEEGLGDLERACVLAEKYGAPNGVKALVYNNLGNALERMGKHAEALNVLDKGIAYDPNDPFPHYNRGIALLRLNRQREAIQALDRSVVLQPPNDSVSRLNNADARYNRGMGRLLLGELKDGFADYEYRLVTSENTQRNFGLPSDKKLAAGADIAGKSILVYCEQGLGDDIQFFRYLQPLIDKGPSRIGIVTHSATKPLIAHLPLTFVEKGQELVPAGGTAKTANAFVYDHWVALMSLPLCLGLTEEAQIPKPYWFPVETDRVERWRDQMAPAANKLKVGVVWAGNWQHKNDAHRSIALGSFATLFDAPGCQFVSLQQLRPGEASQFAELQARYAITALHFTDFRDTAAALFNLDVVVSVDTAVAHLAGTLGVDTAALIPAFSTDWRWQLNRADSPWYPSMSLYRQTKVGDWNSVLVRLKGDLTAMAAQRAAA